MSIFKRDKSLLGPSLEPGRYRIRIVAEDGEVYYWHKRGRIHLVDEEVARIFVANFKPHLFQVAPDGSLQSPDPARTKAIRKVEMERVR